MAKYSTKYFGEIILDETKETTNLKAKYKGQDISILFEDFNAYKDKLDICWDIMDQYDKADEIARNLIFEYFLCKDSKVYGYFEYLFEGNILKENELYKIFNTNSFENMDVKNVIKKWNIRI